MIKVSQLIKHLEEALDNFGDVEVRMPSEMYPESDLDEATNSVQYTTCAGISRIEEGGQAAYLLLCDRATQEMVTDA